MKPMQLAAALFVLGVAVGGYYWMFAEEQALPAADEVAQATQAASEESDKPPHPASSKTPVVTPVDKELSDDDPAGELQLEGQVLDADDLPVEGAKVSLSSRPPRHKETGKDGTFSFSELVGRRYRITARAGSRVAGPVVHELSEKSEPVILRMRPGAAIEVKVSRAEDGKPIAGASIELRSGDGLHATTDSEGKAKVEGVSGGYVTLVVRAVSYAPVHKLVAVPSAGTEPVLIKVSLSGGAGVSGLVTDEAGLPISGAKVLAEDVTALLQMANHNQDGAESDAEGRFSLPALAKGSYRFSATHKDYPAASSKTIELDGKRSRAGIRIVLAGGGRIAGRVEGSSGQAVPWASVRVGRADEQAFSGGLTGPRRRGALADGEGRFEIKGLPRMGLVVMARGEEASSPTLKVDLTAEAEKEDLVLRMTVNGRISGKVVTSAGEPVPEVSVLATPDVFKDGLDADKRLRGRTTAMTDGGGGFVLKGLTQGHYELRALRSAGSNRASLKAGVKAKTGDEDVRLVLDREGGIKGQVLFAEGGSPASFSVTLNLPPAIPVSSAEGLFDLPGVAPSEYEVTIRGEGFADKVVSGVVVKPEETTDMGSITVHAGRTLAGRVLDGRGQPVAEAIVLAGLRLVGDGSHLTLDLGQAARDGMGLKQTRSGVDGRYRLGGLSQSRYLIVAEHADLGRSKVVGFDAKSGGGDLDLVIEGLGELMGVVSSNGQPVAGATVAVSPKAEAEQKFVVHAASDGSYRFEKLTAGDYSLFGAMPGQGLSQNVATSEATVVAGQRNKVDIDIPVGEVKLTVQVTGLKGAKLDAAQVLLVKGQVQASTAAEINQAIMMAGGNVKAAFWSAQMPASFSGVVPGEYSLCVIPLNGNLGDPVFMQKIQKNKDLLKVYCSALPIPPHPTEQSHAVAVPAMDPLPVTPTPK